MDQILDFLKNLRTEQVMEYLNQAKVEELITNPMILGIIAVFVVVCLFMKWRVLLISVLAVFGFAFLLSYTMQSGTSLEGGMGNNTLLVFIGAGAVIIGAVIYFLFIRGE